MEQNKDSGFEFRWIAVDGNINPDLSKCLNLGIAESIRHGCEFIHWAHPDMEWIDPQWLTTLAGILDSQSQILKICASNGRDDIGPFRIGQEQSWLMRTKDFEEFPWLWFHEGYIRCGGCEDYDQHLNILGRGYRIFITPAATVYHSGATTRSSYCTQDHQFFNHQIFASRTGFMGLEEIHKEEFIGWFDKGSVPGGSPYGPETRKLRCYPQSEVRDKLLGATMPVL